MVSMCDIFSNILKDLGDITCEKYYFVLIVVLMM